MSFYNLLTVNSLRPQLPGCRLSLDADTTMEVTVIRSKTSFAILTIALAAGFSAAGSGPDISVDSMVRDLGEVVQGKVLEVEFEVVNTGDEPLEIEARPTCGCTVLDFDQFVEPGSTGSITALVDTAEFSGPITKSVLVTSNARQAGALTLTIRADVKPVLEILPRALVRLNTTQGTPASSSVIVTSASGSPFEITAVDTQSPNVAAVVRRLSGDELMPGRGGSQYEVTVSLSADAPAGMVNVPVTIRTDQANARTVELKVVGFVKS